MRKSTNGFVARNGENGIHHRSHLRVPKIECGEENQKWLCSPNVDKRLHHAYRHAVPNARRGGKKQKWLGTPHVGKVATSPLLSRGSPALSAGRKSKISYAAQMWKKWLHHPCCLWGPQCSMRGKKSQMAMRPTCGQSSYITPPVSGVPNAQRGEKRQKWLCGPHVGKLATSPLPSGSLTLSLGRQTRNGCVCPTFGHGCYITPTIARVPGTRCRGESGNAYVAHIGQVSYITDAV